MGKIISCCGTFCSDCEYYPHDCAGCQNLKGKVFWLPYIDANICPIFDCCINKNHYQHCGLCKKLPCDKLHINDPTKSAEENAEMLKMQIEQLKKLSK